MTQVDEYVAYHAASARVGDIDPSYAMLRYICDRFELSLEQRYWVAFLYAMTYCGASAFYVYNEFPDYENVDVGRLQRWWQSTGRASIICQTDRRWVRSGNQLVPAFQSYRRWVGGGTQHDHFDRLGVTGEQATPEVRHDRLFASARQLYSFGQFSLFLYLEALHTVAGLRLAPTELDLNEAHSCRNGLCYAYGLDRWLTAAEEPMPPGSEAEIGAAWVDVRRRLRAAVAPMPTVWAIETTLCAYKKFKRGHERYVGYYLDRQAIEIAKMARNVPDGVAWRVLWQFRAETFDPAFLAERFHDRLHDGFQARMKQRGISRTAELVGHADEEWVLQ